jgi:hypothetical protein
MNQNNNNNNNTEITQFSKNQNHKKFEQHAIPLKLNINQQIETQKIDFN